MKALLQITMETYIVSDTDIQLNELCLNNANNRKTTFSLNDIHNEYNSVYATWKILILAANAYISSANVFANVNLLAFWTE